jgi:dTMP kinase
MSTDRGRLIVFEAPEGAGKTTQLRLLTAWLDARRVPILAVREPGGTPLGDEIRAMLLDPARELSPRTEALLFMTSRAELVERVIRPALDRGHMVLADRFFLSTYAYQVHGRGLPFGDVRAANAIATGGLVPDVTLLLTLRAADRAARAAARGAADRIESAGDDFHERVAAAFARFASADWQAKHPECGPIVDIDARGTEQEVFARVLAALGARWPRAFEPAMAAR